MPNPRSILCALLLGVTMPSSCPVSGQDYPTKPIRIVTSQPGSSNDLVARLIAQAGLSTSLGQPVIVDNRGIVAAEIAREAAADGYTILSYGSPLWISPLVRKVPWDAVKDFAPITLTVDTPNLLVVHPSVPVKSVQELIALAKARPGKLDYGSSSTGATPHLAAELFKAMAGVNIVRIPYRGSGPALNALVGGQVQLMFPNAGAAAPHVKSGRVRALAVTTARPSALAPGLPTMAASGLPGYESSSPLGIFAPAKTPAAIVNRLQREIVKTLNREDVKERLFVSGVEVVGSSPEQLENRLKSEIARWGKLIKEADIREQGK